MSNLRVLVMSFGLFLIIPFGGGANGALYVPNSVTPKCILKWGDG